MSAPRQFADLNQVALPPQPLHLAIGMFDGLHRGHQSVINAALAGARGNGGLAGVLTFWPHPSVLFRPTALTQMLMSPEMKRAVLGRLGLDFIIEQNFSPALAQIAAEDFLPYLQRSLPQLAAIYVGENWRFGRERRGDVGQL
ncbi:MAG: riboflavin biosynthesis protein RibF, partial [Opitutae bacterium]|nr:riboflavin biosynthesis protein RibF [Opitutae bacterium]